MELIPAVQKYHWGKPAKSSMVASLYAANNPEIDPNSPYAELWMGTHPNGPSHLKISRQPLSTFIKSNPEVIGEKVRETFGIDDLPFLLKILSVNTALSIQAHPDKPSAEVLHKERPDLYKDPNHKPEMAIALTPFEMLCGFKAMDEIVECLKNVPELREIIGDGIVNQLAEEKDKPSLRKAYTRLMECPEEVVKSGLDKLMQRIPSMEAKEARRLNVSLLQRLNEQYPGDIGIFSSLFLQYFVLQPGEAVFLPANEPHAYIFGDCVECMAASDNVVRAGLTPKFKDVQTLCKMLTYEAGKEWVIEGKPCADGKGIEYNPPVAEFAVTKYESDAEFVTEPQRDSCSIFLCVQGKGKAIMENGKEPINLSPGSVIFLPCNASSSGVRVLPEPGSGAILLFEAFSTPGI